MVAHRGRRLFLAYFTGRRPQDIPGITVTTPILEHDLEFPAFVFTRLRKSHTGHRGTVPQRTVKDRFAVQFPSHGPLHLRPHGLVRSEDRRDFVFAGLGVPAPELD